MSDPRHSSAIDRWFTSTGYVDEPRPVRESRLKLIEEFSGYMETGPDELIERCLRVTDSGHKKIRSKQRRLLNEAIDAFVQKTGRTGHEATSTGNTIRSFFIHNGVFMQGVPSVD